MNLTHATYDAKINVSEVTVVIQANDAPLRFSQVGRDTIFCFSYHLGHVTVFLTSDYPSCMITLIVTSSVAPVVSSNQGDVSMKLYS